MFGTDYEEDYIMRQIKNIIDAAVKLVFDVDTTAQFRQEMKADAFANRLTETAGSGNINEAENLLYAKAEERDPDTLRAGLLFYDYLNGMDDGYLSEHGFSREEIHEGLQHLTQVYGVKDVAALFAE